MHATRRKFLLSSAVAASATAINSRVRLGAQPNERVVIGLIGPGGMGLNLLRSFASFDDVEIAIVCDPDEHRAAQAAKIVQESKGKTPRQVKDLRRVLDHNEIDAVIIATPDHWHAPATLLACDAGKHVYVEKPASHNVREGRLMVEAAARTRRLVQVGMQSRSTEHVRRAIELLHSGVIGEVLAAKVWNSQLRGNIGRAQPSEPPGHLDFDLWLGPAPRVPYQANLLPGTWRWWHPFGTGDMGNDGVHDLDIARWGLGVDQHPTRIAAIGGKYYFDDDQQFPDTQTVVFEYDGSPKKQLTFEQRIWSPYVQEGHENGNAFYGTKGMMILGKGKGWQIFHERNKPGEEMTGRPDGQAHHRNFLSCIKDGKQPNADILNGHHSAALCHLGNISTRVGRVLRFDGAREAIIDDTDANGMLRREYRQGHWAVPRNI